MSRPTRACRRRCYRAALAKFREIQASLTRKVAGDARNAPDANRWAAVGDLFQRR